LFEQCDEDAVRPAGQNRDWRFAFTRADPANSFHRKQIEAVKSAARNQSSAITIALSARRRI
jgi:hypothetical protein